MSDRVHVLEVVGNGILGGMETYVLRLLAGAPREQFRFSVFCPFESSFSAQARALGAEVHVVRMPEELDWHALDNACAWVNAEDVNVLHAHLANAHALAGVVGKLTQRPVLATIHSRQLSVLDLEAHRLTGSQLSVVCRYSYLHALSVGVLPAHAHCIANGVDGERFSPATEPTAGARWRHDHGLSPDTPLVGFVGRLSWEKGPELFVRMALLVHARLPQVQFVMMGEGPLRESIESLIHNTGLEQCAHVLGAITDMPLAYRALDVLVSSSHSEAMPLAVLEAMASGVPVVAAAVGGVLELVEHDTTGELVPPNDCQAFAQAVSRILGAPECARTMGQAGRTRALACFPLSASIDRMLQLLRQLAQPQRRHINTVESLTLRDVTSNAP